MTTTPSEVLPDLAFDVELEPPGQCSRCKEHSEMLFVTTSPCICRSESERGLTTEQFRKLSAFCGDDIIDICWLSAPNANPLDESGGPTMPMCWRQKVCFECLVRAEDNIEKNVAKAFGKEPS